jgi:putative phosphoesterase
MILHHLEGCDEIWHAGDFGENVTEQLSGRSVLRGVFGNIDDKKIRSIYPEDLWMTAERLTIWMTHIAGTPPNYNPRIRAQLKIKHPDLLICGHSHITRISKDEQYGNMVYLNPGAAGHHGFHRIRTLVTLMLHAGKITDLKVIELGKRGLINTP